jgi:hypothetical protein
MLNAVPKSTTDLVKSSTMKTAKSGANAMTSRPQRADGAGFGSAQSAPAGAWPETPSPIPLSTIG